MAFLVLLIPLAGTSLGALLVFFMKKRDGPGARMLLTGFASGVMLAASVWSLIIPAIDMSGGWYEALVGFILGVLFLIFTDKLSPIPSDTDDPHRKTRILAAAVTLHNIPEGMAVGVALAGALSGTAGITLTDALSLSLGIAIQNIPEGAIISMPLAGAGTKKRRAFTVGVMSGVPEPVAGALTLLLVSQITVILPYLLAFAAGAMFAVVVKELVPESVSDGHPYIGTLSAAAGFAVMMVLDVAFG